MSPTVISCMCGKWKGVERAHHVSDTEVHGFDGCAHLVSVGKPPQLGVEKFHEIAMNALTEIAKSENPMMSYRAQAALSEITYRKELREQTK